MHSLPGPSLRDDVYVFGESSGVRVLFTPSAPGGLGPRVSGSMSNVPGDVRGLGFGRCHDWDGETGQSQSFEGLKPVKSSPISSTSFPETGLKVCAQGHPMTRGDAGNELWQPVDFGDSGMLP